MRERVVRRRQVDVDVVAVDLHRKPAQVVGPLVERAAGAEIEASVVPVAGEDPVADRPAVKREAHVRATVVDGVDLAPVGDEADRVPAQVNDQPLGLFQLHQRGGSFALRGLHGFHRWVSVKPQLWFKSSGRAELSIGEVAQRSGVAPSALRFYEHRGLIASTRTDGNQRRYDRAVLRRIALIQAGRAAGSRSTRSAPRWRACPRAGRLTDATGSVFRAAGARTSSTHRDPPGPARAPDHLHRVRLPLHRPL